MKNLEFQLGHGLPFGKGGDVELQYDVVLRELTTADVLDASMEAEKVVFNEEGEAICYTSNVLLDFAVLRRQVSNIGVINGPLTFEQLRQLNPADIALLQHKAGE